MNAPDIKTTSATAASTGNSLDLKSLRLAPNYGATLGVKKVLTTVPVGKPKKAQFFRVHSSPDMVFPTMLLEQKETRETYVVLPEVAQAIAELVRPVELFLAIDRQNDAFLIPVALPGEDGTRNPWVESLAQAVQMAKAKWIRIATNMSLGAYDVYEAQADLPEPEWPKEHDIDSLIEVAFRGKVIRDLEHPVVQSLLGYV